MTSSIWGTRTPRQNTLIGLASSDPQRVRELACGCVQHQIAYHPHKLSTIEKVWVDIGGRDCPEYEAIIKVRRANKPEEDAALNEWKAWADEFVRALKRHKLFAAVVREEVQDNFRLFERGLRSRGY